MAIKYTTPEVAKNTTSRDIEALAAQECKLQEKSVEYTQVLGESHLSKLADEQKAIATNKNWILA